MLSADGPPGPVRPREPHSPYSGQRAALYANSRDRGPAKARDSLDSDAGGRRPPEDDSLRRIIAQLDAEGVHGEDSRYENEDSHFDAGDLGFDFDAELQGQGPPWASPDPNSLGSFTPGSFTPGRHSIDGLSAAYSPDASPIRRREPLNRDSAGSTGLQRTSVNSRPSYGTSPSSYARPSDSHSPFHPHTRYSSGKEGQLPRNLSLGDRDPRIPAPAPIPADSTDFRAHPSREPVFDYDYPNSASRERGQRHAGSFNAHEGSERSFDASSATYRPATTVTTSTGTTLKDRVPVRASDSARESRNSMGEQNLQSALNEARKTADDLRFQNRELRLVLEDTRKELDTALYSKEKSLLDLESEWQSKHDALRLESSDQIAQLKDQLAQVTRRLAASTSEDRANWEREKELELLSVKKAVWEEKERQLVELRAQMNDEAARARREADSELRTRDAEITRLRGLLRKDTADVGVQCDVDVGAIGLLADVLGEPPELPLPRLVQIAADSLASRENIIRRQAVELEEKDRTIVEMRREQPSIVAGKVREVRVALEKEMAERLDEERGARETEARDLRRHYETELERLRDSHEARTEELRARLRAAEEERDRTPELSLEELERLFPGHVATLRSEWDAEVANRIREVEERADAERAAHEREMGQMRAQYSDAYSAAIGKLKDEYARLEGKMAERYRVELERRQVAWDKERDEIRRNHEMEIRDVAERARRDPNGELRREARRLEDKVAETERTVATLKDALAEAALEHSQAMQELKKRMGEEHQMILLKVKDKYLTTLRGMRDDVAASKERSAERMEIEWRKRKEKLEGEWSARLEQLRETYETELRRYRASAVEAIGDSERDRDRDRGLGSFRRATSRSRR